MQNFLGKTIPNFTVSAVLKNGELTDNYNILDNIKNKYAIIFFYPMDFTFVCPSELLALNNRIDRFISRNIEVLTVSIDSKFVHKAWRDTKIDEGGLENNVNYTMLSDLKKELSSTLGFLDDKSGVSYRGTIILDKKSKVRIQHINDFPIGRNIDEYIRLIDAIIFNDENGEVCQAGWKKGDRGINPSKDGVSDFLKKTHKNL
jgi:peroxiredoxin (alkyl hydroperoxide reductase subunit C)